MKTRFLLTLSILLTFGQVAFSQEFPFVFDKENRTDNCLNSAVNPIPSTSLLPDPFLLPDGSGRISTLDEWNCHRNEIKSELEYYEIGQKPPKPENVTATYSGGRLTVTVQHNGQTINITSSFTIPSGAGPHPVLITINGGIGSGLPSGVISAPYSHDQVTTYNGKSSNDPFYRMYPNLTNGGQYAAWAWGVSRLIDGLEIIADDYNIDMTGIGIIGCSYAGKMSLFSGALDDRLALVIAQESGGGGINAWRYTYQNGDVENIGNTNGDWFMSSMLSRDPRVFPHDHHELIGMIAPRAFLAFGNEGFVWMDDASGYKTLMSSIEIWKAMGIEDRFGFDMSGGHNHCTPASSQQTAGGAFVRKFLMHDNSQNTLIRTSPTYSGATHTWTTPTITANTNAPNVSIISPTQSSFLADEEIIITAQVTDQQNDVVLVEFFDGNTKIGEDASAPYSLTWSTNVGGSHSLSAVATDSEGNTGSGGKSITIVAPQGPFGGTPSVIPGIIQFEDFDTGGQDSAYYDDSPGNEADGNCRPDEDVDLETCSDVGGGCNIGWFTSGEWVEYTVNVQSAGTYDLTIRYAVSGTGRTINLTMNGLPIASNVSLPTTGDWQTWDDLIIEDIELNAGKQVLRVTMGATDYVNLNYMTWDAGVDLCPNDPNKTVPGECGCGVEDIDTDNDDVYDCNDLCPLDPLKTEPGTCGCGTPEGECSDPITLTAGWNLVGCPLEGATALETALSSIWQYTVIVKNLDSFYDKNQPEFLNLLTEMERGSGYLIYVSDNCELRW